MIATWVDLGYNVIGYVRVDDVRIRLYEKEANREDGCNAFLFVYHPQREDWWAELEPCLQTPLQLWTPTTIFEMGATEIYRVSNMNAWQTSDLEWESVNSIYWARFDFRVKERL